MVRPDFVELADALVAAAGSVAAVVSLPRWIVQCWALL